MLLTAIIYLFKKYFMICIFLRNFYKMFCKMKLMKDIDKVFSNCLTAGFEVINIAGISQPGTNNTKCIIFRNLNRANLPAISNN